MGEGQLWVVDVPPPGLENGRPGLRWDAAEEFGGVVDVARRGEPVVENHTGPLERVVVDLV